MRRTHFDAWTPHCPVCARDRGRTPALLLTAIALQSGDDVVSATLVCADPACRAEYPVIDGIPMVMANLRAQLGERAVELLLRDDLDPLALSLLGDAMGPGSWLDSIRQTVSTYAWDAYADQDPQESPASSPDPKPGAAARCLEALLALLPRAERSADRRVLDLGCGAGRTAFECAADRPGALVLGIDANLALLRVARRAATRSEIAYGRRRVGLVYDERRFTVSLPGADRVDFWACDAAALPFAPETTDLIVALNLLDCLPDPVAFLQAAAGLLRPGGGLLLATPFDWAIRATPAEHWIGGHSQRGDGMGAAEPLLAALLSSGVHPRSAADMKLIGTGEIAWHTRLHDRAAVAYRSHLAAAVRTVSRVLDSQP